MTFTGRPESIDIKDYTYTLPDEKIARFPLADRSASNLLIYKGGEISHTRFSDIHELSEKRSLMVFNNTRVIQARIILKKETGARIEIFLLEPQSPGDYSTAFSTTSSCIWKCITGNKKKWKSGVLKKELRVGSEDLTINIRLVKDHGSWQEIEFRWAPDIISFGKIVDSLGITPIPPYLKRSPVDKDRTCYQTVYSKFKGSVAAPTAGLHFTEKILDKLTAKKVMRSEITLHVGAGTFQPVKAGRSIINHPMHAEHFSLPLKEIKKIRDNTGNITTVGTTTTRTLESLYWLGVKYIYSAGSSRNKLNLNNTLPDLDQWDYLKLPGDISTLESLNVIINYMESSGIENLHGKTELMIIPGYNFKLTNRMVTNFHQPQSTLLLLIAAFIGDDWQKVYNYALENDFRFLSYGDSSILIP